MLKHDAEIIRDAFSRKGLSGVELEAAMLAYKIAHNLPCKEDDMFGKKKIAKPKKIKLRHFRTRPKSRSRKFNR